MNKSNLVSSNSQHKGISNFDYVIIAKSLTKFFKVNNTKIYAISDCSFKVKPGIITGLIGPDGSGKTTFMRLCAGLLTQDEGELRVLGFNPKIDFLRIQSEIRYMPQKFGLYEDLTVQENLELYSDLLGISEDERKERFKQLLAMTGLSNFTSRLAGKLSGGMKQKLGLACTLLKPPKLLLLDEPTVGVDPVSRRELWHIVYKQVEELKMSVLLSTSYLDEAERCQEVILMHEGKILGQGQPKNFSLKLKGHTFMLRPKEEKKRSLQQRLANEDEVVDSLILGNRIRLVTWERLDEKDVRIKFDLDPDIAVEVSEPRFEDAFIWLLKKRLISQGKSVRFKIISHKQVSGAKDEDVISVKNLTKCFGNFCAVDNISFSVKRGEVFGLLGANGAGKTTTFRMLCGLLLPTSGELRVAGMDLSSVRAEARSKIGYMAQKFSLYAELTVEQNLKFFSSAYGLYGNRQKEKINWALESFELDKKKDAISGSLPLGYKQRLALAASLMHEPDILFLDEPTSGVDPLARRQFWAHINTLSNANVTIMVTTHFMEEAEYCDRIVIMKSGKILAEGSPEDLKTRYRSKGSVNPTMEETFLTLVESQNEQEKL